MKTILRYLSQLMQYIATPEYDVPLLCSLEIQEEMYKRYFSHKRQRVHDKYAHGNVVWRDHEGEPK